MSTIKLNLQPKPQKINATELIVGEIMVTTTHDILMRFTGGFAYLNFPYTLEFKKDMSHVKGYKLLPGESVIITQQ